MKRISVTDQHNNDHEFIGSAIKLAIDGPHTLVMEATVIQGVFDNVASAKIEDIN